MTTTATAAGNVQPAGRAACGCTPADIRNKHERPANVGSCAFTRRPDYNPWAGDFARTTGPYRNPRPALVICSAHDGDHTSAADCRYPYIPARLADHSGA